MSEQCQNSDVWASSGLHTAADDEMKKVKTKCFFPKWESFTQSQSRAVSLFYSNIQIGNDFKLH